MGFCFICGKDRVAKHQIGFKGIILLNSNLWDKWLTLKKIITDQAIDRNKF